MSTLAELATRAADLIEAAPENAWTQGAFARTSIGTDVPSRSRWAVCWCAVGFLRKHDYAQTGEVPIQHVCSIMNTNDRATDRADAIARLRALAAAVSA